MSPNKYPFRTTGNDTSRSRSCPLKQMLSILLFSLCIMHTLAVVYGEQSTSTDMAEQAGRTQEDIREELATLRQQLVQVRLENHVHRERWESENEEAREWTARVNHIRDELNQAITILESLWRQERASHASFALEAELVKRIQELTAELQ